ncbi:uncharacterized protein METZ01_LOCUS124873 [marine metagenome]|uniref:Uncharacterized protein n=1 Tax=marine metagenome TaxID=408172 RepID=A0A381Y4K5_9ZZZZ
MHQKKPVPATDWSGSNLAMQLLFQCLGTVSSTKCEMNQHHFAFCGPPAGTFTRMLDRARAGIQGVPACDAPSKGRSQVIRYDE